MEGQEELEIEIKVRLESLEGWPEKLTKLGFQERHPLQPEHSTLWDREGQLLAQGSALRVRNYAGRTLLTWKGPRTPDPRLKIRPERETAVEDGEALAGILRGLGFSPWMDMEKQRALWEGRGLVVCLDQAPFGAFIELEGSRTHIETAFQELGLEPTAIEPRSYPALFREAEK